MERRQNILFIKLVFTALMFITSCTRNPLGEEVYQEILNFGFVLSHSCTTTASEYSNFTCQITLAEPIADLQWILTPENTCTWAAIDSSTGEISGTTTNANINGCNLVVRAQTDKRRSTPLTIPITVTNVAPTLTIANAAAISEDSLATVIRSAADVQASEEGNGGSYSFDHLSTTSPRCFDYATTLTTNSVTGETVFSPATNYNGTCNIRIFYNDGGGWPDSTVSSEFSITVNPVNDAPVISSIGNQGVTEGNVLALNFTITDVDNTLSCATSVNATSTNTSLIPVSSITISGTAPNCTATLTHAAFQNGSSNIVFTLSDGSLQSSTAFTYTVSPTNDAPVISAITAQSVNEDNSVVVNFTVTDVDNTLGCLSSVSATTSNAALMPAGNIVLGGTAPNCTATLTPTANQSGLANLTLTVSDGSLTDTASFSLTVNPVNDPPTISAITNRVIQEDASVVVAFTVADLDSSLNCSSSLSATSSNLTLLPGAPANIAFGGTFPNCTVTLAPALNQNGISNLTITVSDGTSTAASNFSLTVNSENDSPVLSLITNQTTSENVSLPVSFTINDPDNTLSCSSSVSATTSNATLLPVSGIVLTGTAPNCTATLTPANYQYGVSNLIFTLSDGSATVTRSFSLTVNQIYFVPTISYTGSYTLQAGQALAPGITPTLGGTTPNSCTASPTLPTGLAINPTTCIISGTPTVTTAQQTYTITATNVVGTASATVSLGVQAAGPNNISLTGVSNFITSTCSVFTITTRDAFGNLATVSSDTTFNLSGAGTNGTFYSDASCSLSTTNVLLPSGSSSTIFYYRKSTAGTTSLIATLASPASPALGSASRSVNVTAAAPARLGVTMSATGTTVTCNSIAVNVLDSNNNSVNATANMTVTLSGTGTPAFYSNASCATSATTVVINSGSNTATMYMRKITTGNSTVTAAAAGVANGSATISISSAPAERIRFSSAAAVPYAASTCQAYTLQTRDALNNNTVAVTSDTVVNLSGVADGSFYSNSTCTLPITTTTILNGTSARTIYYSKPTTTAAFPGSNIVLTAAVAGWSPDATTSVNVSTGAPTHLATTNTAIGIAILSATNVAIGSRCLVTTVRVNDESNALVPASRVTSSITANLSGGGAGAQFWSDANCTTPISSVTINAGANTANFYYSSTTTTPTVAISWTNGGLSGNGGSRNVTVTSGVPSRLTWTTAPTTFNTSTCQTYVFNVRDSNTVTAVGANVSTATDFQLTDSSNGTFYSVAGCSTPITTVQIAAGAQTKTFYYRKTSASTATISVSLLSPLNPTITTLNQAITVNSPAPVPNNVLISASPSTGLVANQSCSALTLLSRSGSTAANVTADSTYTLSGTNGVQFYLDSGCTAAATTATMTIVNGTNTINGLYIKGTNSGAVAISGTGSLTTNTLNLSYSPTPPTMLAIAGPSFLTAGLSCGSYTVSTQDALENNRNVLANTTVTFASVGAQAVQFYSDSTCSTTIPGNQMTLNTGSNTLTFYVRGGTPGSAQIQTSATGLTTATHSLILQ